jgi:hypothetical protein
MNAFSQLNGQASLSHRGQAELPVDWPGAAFSQLNTFDFFEASTQKTQPLWAWAFSQLNAPQGSTLAHGCNPSLWRGPFSRLNTWPVGRHVSVTTNHSTSETARGRRVFSQLNAKWNTPLWQAQKNAVAQAVFSQLNTLGFMVSWTSCSGASSHHKQHPHRPDFRDLKPRAHTQHTNPALRGVRCIWNQDFGEIT